MYQGSRSRLGSQRNSRRRIYFGRFHQHFLRGTWCFRYWWSLGSGGFGPSLSYSLCILCQRLLPHLDSSVFLLDLFHEVFDVTRPSRAQLVM